MTRFAGQDNILGRIQELEKASEEGSIPYLTPYMSSQNPPKGGLSGSSYFDTIEDKRKELDDIVNTDGGPWKKREESEEEVEIEVPDKSQDSEEPKNEKSAGRLWTEKNIGKGSLTDEELTWRMKLNPATTPEDWARAFGKCRTVKYTDKHPESSGGLPSDCYWPEESGLKGSDFYKVGGGGRKSAPRGKSKGATRSGGGTGHGGG